MDKNYNSRSLNSGDYNSGYYNTGYYNTGHRNSGHYNSGDRNTGHRNSGYYNTGYRNSGDYNSGDYNSGNYNSGDYNSRNYNTGDYNTGDYNSGNYNTGFFNTDEPNARLFNKECNKKISDIVIPFIDLKLTEWVPIEDMTKDQKEINSGHEITGGFLLKRTYKEAWAEAWLKLSNEDKQKFLNLPNFDADIFEEITGIKVNVESVEHEEVITLNGKKYKLIEE